MLFSPDLEICVTGVILLRGKQGKNAKRNPEETKKLTSFNWKVGIHLTKSFRFTTTFTRPLGYQGSLVAQIIWPHTSLCFSQRESKLTLEKQLKHPSGKGATRRLSHSVWLLFPTAPARPLTQSIGMMVLICRKRMKPFYKDTHHFCAKSRFSSSKISCFSSAPENARRSGKWIQWMNLREDFKKKQKKMCIVYNMIIQYHIVISYEHITYVFLTIAQRLQEHNNHVNKLKTTHTDCLRVAIVFSKSEAQLHRRDFALQILFLSSTVRGEGLAIIEWYKTPKIQSQGISNGLSH